MPANLFPDRDFTARMVPIGSLRPRATNPRQHGPKQLKKLTASLQAFGWTNPIIVDEQHGILCGHGRYAAAGLLGMTEVPVITLGDLTDAQKAAYVIADNAIAAKAGWSRRVLASELQGLIEVGFDVELTGFDTIEVDEVLTVLDGTDEQGEMDVVPVPGAGRPVSRPGDLWSVGDHRVLCGNALEADAYQQLMRGCSAEMVFTDPPFNVPIGGHVSGLGRTTHGEFAMAAGEMTADQFTSFLRQVMRHLRAASGAGAIHYLVMDWRHMRELLDAADGVYAELKNLCVWAKTNAGMGSFYRSQHELVFVFKATPGKHLNNFGLGEGGRYRSNLWTYAGANTFRPGRMADLEAHPTAKPVRLVADAIRDCSRRGGIILDPFLGSGTTAVAAARMGRRGYGIEIDPAFVDLVVRRLQEEAGEDARDANGLAFGDAAGRP